MISFQREKEKRAFSKTMERNAIKSHQNYCNYELLSRTFHSRARVPCCDETTGFHLFTPSACTFHSFGENPDVRPLSLNCGSQPYVSLQPVLSFRALVKEETEGRLAFTLQPSEPDLHLFNPSIIRDNRQERWRNAGQVEEPHHRAGSRQTPSHRTYKLYIHSFTFISLNPC